MVSGYAMREPCTECGHAYGKVVTVNGQDTVRCEICSRFAYNAPRVETGREKRSVSRNREPLKPSKVARIRMRDGIACVLCHHADRPTHIGHLIAVKGGLEWGLTREELDHDENLAVMCDECNLGIGDHPIPPRLFFAMLQLRITTRKIDDEEGNR